MHAKLKGWLVLFLLLGTLTYAIAEELTLTTYYPSPRGVYQELRTRGDMAIGKLDAPGARLEIVGGGATSATSALRIRNVDQASLLEVQNNGNVGIGTASPTQKLDIDGQIRVRGGNPGPGKVLASADASGLASWQVLDAVPAGFVGFFALLSCPAGWSPYGPAMGRYVVGASSSIGSTVGTTLSNLENRAVGQHSHGITDPGHAHPLPPMALAASFRTVAMYEGSSGPVGSTGVSATGISVVAAGSVDGTNAPYIQLLACQKN